MSTDVDICNLALSFIGDSAVVTSITGADTSIQATQCARFYPIVRDQVLERHPWKFQLKYAALTAASVTLPDNWAYAYTLPDNCLSIVNILKTDTIYESYIWPTYVTADVSRVAFSVEMVGTAQVLYCNQDTVTVQYTEKVTDVSKYPASLVSAMAMLLAAYLAGPIIKGKAALQMTQALRQQFEVAVLQAQALDAAFTHTESNRSYTATSIRARL